MVTLPIFYDQEEIMCFYSLCATYGEKIPKKDWTKNSWKDFKDVLEDSKSVDRQLGLTDCQDVDKTWIDELDGKFGE